MTLHQVAANFQTSLCVQVQGGKKRFSTIQKSATFALRL